MTEKITVFTKITPSYKYSSELLLCLKMFRQALPEGSSVIISEEDHPAALKDSIIKQISDITPYVLIVKEPSLLMRKGSVETMLQAMKVNADILCVLPSDIRGFRSDRTASYYTLKGFERFAESLYDPEQPVMPYDKREPWMFLIKDTALREMDIPGDPMDIPNLLPAKNICISLNAYIHPFINYYQETRTDVLPLVPENIESLLDIGCSRGNFGAMVQKKIGCRVVGVEINPYEARKAAEQLDLVIEGDFLTTDIKEKFDCVTCLDVIEHTVHPDVFLQKVRTLLHNNGYLILSVPNIGHWSIIEDLIAGRWDYTPAGTLCISHLRFFTKKTIQPLLEDAQFRMMELREQSTPLPDSFINIFTLLKKSGIETDEKSLSCLGYYILAQKIN